MIFVQRLLFWDSYVNLRGLSCKSSPIPYSICMDAKIPVGKYLIKGVENGLSIGAPNSSRIKIPWFDLAESDIGQCI